MEKISYGKAWHDKNNYFRVLYDKNGSKLYVFIVLNNIMEYSQINFIVVFLTLL